MYCTTSQKFVCWMGMTVDNRHTLVPRVLDLKKSVANKLELLRHSRFLPKDFLQKFCFSVIFPFIMCGLILWGLVAIPILLAQWIERLHRRASRIIYNLPKDMAASHALNLTNWTTIRLNYKLKIIKLFFNANNYILPHALVRESLAREKVLTHYRSGQCFHSEIQQKIHERLIRLSRVSSLEFS